MDVISPNWPAPPRIKALSTTRLGGVSQGVYSALNLGDHVNDDSASVKTNREILENKGKLPNSPAWLEQIHGDLIVEVNHRSIGTVPRADGAWSAERDVICAVLTADCMPVLMTNRRGTKVAAVHAGWRGLAAGIVEKGVDIFDEEADQILVWAGPCIGPRAFEVGTEVQRQLGGPEEAYTPASSAGKVFANLALIAKQRLKAVGVSEFYSSNLCTYSDPHRYFSYRRDGQCGRMASLIWIESER